MHLRGTTAAAAAAVLAACSTPASNPSHSPWTSVFPLQRCEQAGDPARGNEKNCRVSLFTPGADIGQRNPKDFPQRYLELYDPKVRQDYCDGQPESARADCARRLKILSDYFNPGGRLPGPDEIGLALEGGGTKAASFSMGTLAGLHALGLLEGRITAIASVSGGSYAASYYYNRWFDRLRHRSYDQPIGDWFRSCIPAYFILHKWYGTIDEDVRRQSCGEKVVEDGRLRNGPKSFGDEYFSGKYRYIGHVWTNHDLLGGDTPGDLTTQEDPRIPQFLHAAWIFAETVPTIPFQFVARTLFRWPLNTAPSKLYYKLGLEREYGYSPQDWRAAGSSDLAHFEETLFHRRETRTLKRLGELVNEQMPSLKERSQQVARWIIGSSAPGSISAVDWLLPAARDPIRQQFELTWDGYGSGIYGYALQPPESFREVFAKQPDGMPIVDAVIASAAFFDDDQSAISSEPVRLGAGAAQQFINLDWFTEIRNYNVSDAARAIDVALPYPLYLTQTIREDRTPYIHLQDGGNTENAGIFPLLRRGYRTIVYAHGTLDDAATWDSICHLKNQLELDGTYILTSDSLDKLMAKHAITAPGKGDTPGRTFKSFLDGLCSMEFDSSDLAVFDRNLARGASDPATPAVAQLYCARLMKGRDPQAPSGGSGAFCDEFIERFFHSGAEKIRHAGGATRAFFDWPTNRIITFEVRRRDAAENTPPLSRIIAIVPAISFEEFKAQSNLKGPDSPIRDWNDWCVAKDTVRRATTIDQCFAPDGRFLGKTSSAAPESGLPCVAAAHIIESKCTGTPNHQRPQFPQNDFALQTFHTSYTSYAAYFDLARNEVERVLCQYHQDGFVPPPRCSEVFRRSIARR